MEALGESWLSTPDFTGNPAAKGIWTTSLVVANGVFVLFIVAGGFVVTARETLQTQHGLKQILPRLAVGAVAANCSLILFQKLIEWTNALTVAIAANSIDGPTAAAAIRQIVDNVMNGNNFLLTLLVIAVIVMCLVLEITFVMRLAALIILFGIAPVALMCHASPYTEGIAQTWWRAVGACLGLQIGQAIVVMATVKVFLTPAGPTVMGIPSSGDGLLGILVCLTMLWVLIKLPGWMKQFILGPLGQRRGRGLIGTLIQAYLMVKTLGAAAGMARGAGTAARAAGTAAGRPGTTPRPGGPRPSPTGGPRPRPGPSPSPAGPAAFSHAPVTHAPLSSPAGTTGAPVFSNAPSPSPVGPSPSGGVPAAQFSHPSPAETPRPAPATPAARVAFSDAAPATSRSSNGGSAPGVTFSAAPAPHSAPRRPLAPVTPVFSSAPATQAGGPRRGASPASRPTAARRATPPARTGGTAAARTPSASTPRPTPPARRAAAPSPPSPTGRPPVTPSPPPSPRSSPAAGRAAPPSPPSPRLSPRSSPAPDPYPVFRAARPAPSPPSPPPSPPSPPPSPPPRRRPQDRGEHR
ncbi:MAG TPA: conjugal transfer protein TrbL family protein [Micromonosporaceae bacterium]|nr:conjugal transfer protein TrbL family protein [Micromonosporaceae bacterium]